MIHIPLPIVLQNVNFRLLDTAPQSDTSRHFQIRSSIHKFPVPEERSSTLPGGCRSASNELPLLEHPFQSFRFSSYLNIPRPSHPLTGSSIQSISDCREGKFPQFWGPPNHLKGQIVWHGWQNPWVVVSTSRWCSNLEYRDVEISTKSQSRSPYIDAIGTHKVTEPGNSLAAHQPFLPKSLQHRRQYCQIKLALWTEPCLLEGNVCNIPTGNRLGYAYPTSFQSFSNSWGSQWYQQKRFSALLESNRFFAHSVR